MPSKEILKHNGNIVPEINDAPGTQFGDYEVYSRNKVDVLLAALRMNGGYDWSGKTVVFEGESLTANTTTGYPAYVAEKTGCTAVVVAQPGHCLAGNYPGQPYDFRRRVSGYPANADAIVLLGDCLADAFFSSWGDIEDTTETTWFGRWNLMLEGIKKSYPTVPVFLVAEFGQGAGGNDQRITWKVAESFQRLARKWVCHFVDLPCESPLDLKYASSVWGLTSTDHVHAGYKAMPLYADVIIRHMGYVPPFEFSGADGITIAKSSAEVQAGKTVELTVTKTGDLSTRWTSDNMDVACVLGGVVYGMAAGTATITATTRNGNTASCVVTVTEAG